MKSLDFCQSAETEKLDLVPAENIVFAFHSSESKPDFDKTRVKKTVVRFRQSKKMNTFRFF